MVHKMIACMVLLVALKSAAQSTQDAFPIRGFCIAAPKPAELGRFTKFIHEELATRNINTLILRVDFNFQYESYPNLRDSIALTRAEVTKLVDACKQHHIRVIPQINLLGHQSWAGKIGGLLKAFPDFDE